MRLCMVMVALVGAMLVGLSGTRGSVAQAQAVPPQPPPLIIGTVPTTATIALLNVTRDASAAEVTASLAIAGCEAVSLVVNDAGIVRLYAVGVPAFANAGFPTLRASSSFFVLCGERSPHAENIVQYACTAGRSFTAHVQQVPGDRVILEIEGRAVELRQTISGSGTRHVSADGSILYLSKGSEGTIQQDGVTTYEGCTGTLMNTVSGTVTYLEKIALPAGATVRVDLLDTSRADVAASPIASQTRVTNGEQVPLSFRLLYRPTDIVENRTYTVRATIHMDGALRFTTDTSVRVLTDPAATRTVALVLVAVPASPAPTSIVGRWRWVSTVEGSATVRPLTVDDTVLSLDADGSAGTSTDCNLYFGTYTTNGSALTVTMQGGTLRACPAGGTEAVYLAALAKVQQYTQSGNALTLTYPGGAMNFVAQP